MLEELYLARLGIWSGLFYLVLRDGRADAPPILLLGLCVLAASLYPLLLKGLQSLPKILAKYICELDSALPDSAHEIKRPYLRRLPRPCRLWRKAITTLTDELGIHQSFSGKARDRFQKASFVIVFSLVKPERLFI